MGNDIPTQAKKEMDKSLLNIIIKQIYFTAQLNKDRKKGQQNAKEKELLALVRQEKNKRSKENEFSKALTITSDVKSVKAHECVMRYADILKDNIMIIQESKGDSKKISDLVPYVESVIWGCQKCNIDCIKQFEEFLFTNFGPETYAQLCQFSQVTPELQECFGSILPSERETKLYLIDFCNRNEISLDTMNEIGHSLSPTELADLPDPKNQPPTDNSQKPPNNQEGKPGKDQNHPAQYPQQVYGYPQFGHGFPQGYPGGNYSQGFNGNPNTTSNMGPNNSFNPNGNSQEGNVSFGQNQQNNNAGQQMSGYPGFEKFSNVPSQGKPVDDGFSDIEAKLANIKKGL